MISEREGKADVTHLASVFRRPNPHGAVSEEAVREYESRIGFALPGEYRRYLVANNGARPRRRAVGELGTVMSMYGLHEGAELDRLQPRLMCVAPPAIAIADVDGGNQLLLRLAGDPGTVLFWDHETEDASTVVARSFDALIESLTADALDLVEEAIADDDVAALAILAPRPAERWVTTAIAHDSLECFRFLVATNPPSSSLLSQGARSGSLRIASHLLDQGIDPNWLPDAGGFTPLAHAAMRGQRALVALLLRHGADPNAPSVDNCTPMELATHDALIVELLLKAGGKPTTPGTNQIVDWLRRQGRG